MLFAGDAINKAVFTPHELRRGLSKLTQAGYVVDSGALYSLTDAGRQVFERSRKVGGGWLSVWRDLEKQLGATRDSTDHPQFEDPRFRYPQLTDEAVDVADREYRRRFDRMLSELNRKGGGTVKR